MAEALQIFYQIYAMLVELFFNDIEIAANVTIGWVLVTVFIFSVLLRSLLNVPRASRSVRVERKDNE